MVTSASTQFVGDVLGRANTLAMLADAWLADGAEAFEVYLGGQCLWRRGAPVPGRLPTLTAVVQLKGSAELEVHVPGVGSQAAQLRLEAEAHLLAEIVRLEDELQQMTGEFIETQDQLLAVFGLARATRRHLSVEEVLAELVTEVRRLTGAEFAFTVVPDGGRQSRLVCSPEPPDAWREALQGAASWTMSAGTLLVTDARADRPSELDLPPFVRNLVAVPVQIDGRPGAVLGLLNQRETRFSAGTVKLLQALGDQAGGLLESATLHERALARERLVREMEVAAGIQGALLPHDPLVVPGVELAGRFRSAAEVGGDFFDYRLRPNGHLALCVGDVSGKGWPAALVMTMTLAVLRGASQLIDRPSAVLQRVNAVLYADLSRIDAFVTAFVGHYNPGAARLVFASAGHSPVMYRSRGGRTRFLRATGLPLGVPHGRGPTGGAVRLHRGDLLVVATDGFSDATSPGGELFGYQRLLRLVDSVSGLPAAAAADRMFEAITDFAAGRPQDDDQTLLIVKVH